jgi:hypothetical protein
MVSTTPRATPADIEKAIVLMEETDTDVIDVIQHIILESGFNLEDKQILAWLPAFLLRDAIVWLKEEAGAGDSVEVIDLEDK